MQRRADLEMQAENWVKSRQLSDYIRAVEIEASKKGITELSNEKFTFWLRWAKSHADRLDPLNQRLQFEDNESED
jgi:hypothetical protein